MKLSSTYGFLGTISIIGAIFLSDITLVAKAIIVAVFLYGCSFTAYIIRVAENSNKESEWEDRLNKIKELSAIAEGVKVSIDKENKDTK